VPDDKIIIEIELDDGKILKGLAKINSGVQGAAKEAKGLGGQIEQAFGGTAIGRASSGVSDFLSKIRTINPAILLVAGSFAALGASLKAALVGEDIAALNKQFELLGAQAGISTNALRSNLKAATGGAVDFEDVLKSTNKFLVEFGQNSNRIPEVLSIARKASALFGGEVTENFERISQAIASGQTRGLKSLGIIVDQEEAYRRFADSIGVAAASLNEAGKKQAILDEILRKGGETFKNVDPSVRQLSTSIDRLKVQLGDLFDNVATKSSETFGGIFASAINKTSEILERFNLSTKSTGGGLSGMEDSIRAAEFKLQDLDKSILFTQSQIDQFKASGSGAAPIFNLGDLTSEREKLSENLDAMQAKFFKAQQRASMSAKDESVNRAEFVDTAKVTENIEKLKQQLLAAKQERIAAEMGLDLDADQQNMLRNERAALSLEMQQARLFEINKTFRDQGLLGTQLYEDLKTQITAKGEADRAKIISETQEQNRVKIVITSAQIAQAISAGVQQAVMAMKSGQNALKAFTGAIFGFIGDMVIKIGESLISIGLGMEAIRASIVGLTGGPALFAGVALVALGTLLKSLSGGGGSSASADGGGGSGGSVSSASEAPQIEQSKPQSQIAINIQGDVLDSEDTGLRIVDILRSYADKNGDVVTA